ncbi:MAG: HTH-type transcriptional regulator CueR [Bacteroidetes bacterium ADurb.Bin408]|nr:MAG: HTH-type transcriptional regulator CueR [Bacteroidetes bacterium ADurb.Bin408]
MSDNELSFEKLYYTISEVAAMFKVNTSLIRFWEKEFEVIKPHKNKKGNRLFTQSDINNFYTIFHLVKEKGYTLQGAKEVLKNKKSETLENAEIIQSLNKVRNFLTDIKNMMKADD